jgi:hypothetical protein
VWTKRRREPQAMWRGGGGEIQVKCGDVACCLLIDKGVPKFA